MRHHTSASVSPVAATWARASAATARRAPSTDTTANTDSAKSGHTQTVLCGTNTDTVRASTGWPDGQGRRLSRLVDAHSRSASTCSGGSSRRTGHIAVSTATYQNAGLRSRRHSEARVGRRPATTGRRAPRAAGECGACGDGHDTGGHQPVP